MIISLMTRGAEPVAVPIDRVRRLRALDEFAEMSDEVEQRATLEALMIAIDEEPLSAHRRFR
jgi:hypothetical protein